MAKQNNTGKRYSDSQKEKILEFVEKYDEKHERGGMSRAQEKFNVSYLTIRSWMKPGVKAKKMGRPAKTAKPTKGVKKIGRPAKAPADLEATLQALRDQVAQLSARLAKIEVPKVTKAKVQPVALAVAPVVAQAPQEAQAVPEAKPAPIPAQEIIFASPAKEEVKNTEVPVEELVTA